MAYTIKFRNFSFSLKSITVEPVMFLYMYAVFTNFLTYQALIYDKVCAQHFNSTVCNNIQNDTLKIEQDVVQKESSLWILYSNVCMGVPSFFSVMLFLGPWGDKAGRKFPILFPLIGNFLYAVNNILNTYYMSAPISFLLLGNIINGFAGGFVGLLMALYSYITHIATPETRTVKLGILEATVFLSGTLGTATSGVMLDRTSYIFVFSLLCGMYALAFIYTIVWVDNVHVDSSGMRPDQQSFCRTWCLNTLKDTFLCVYHKRKSPAFGQIVVYVIIITFVMVCTAGEMDLILLYTRAEPFSWSQTLLGIYSGLSNFLRGIAVITILPFLKMKFKIKDSTLVIIGLVSKMIMLVLLGVANSTAFLFIGCVAGLLQGFTSAGSRSICAGFSSKDEQAKMFSVIGMLEAIATIAASSLFNTVYRETIVLYPGFCFLMAAFIILVCIILSIGGHLRMKQMVPLENYDTLDEPDGETEEEVDQSDLQIQTYVDEEIREDQS